MSSQTATSLFLAASEVKYVQTVAAKGAVTRRVTVIPQPLRKAFVSGLRFKYKGKR